MTDAQPLEIRSTGSGVVFRVSVAPGARRNGIVGVRNGALRVAVAAAAEKGKANRALLDVLARQLGCPKSSIRLVSGETARDKRLSIDGLDAAALRERLARLLASDLD
jgi:hypothetical protein